jgi:heme/copper-type cytochrome/quinol oxidase subunit 4
MSSFSSSSILSECKKGKIERRICPFHMGIVLTILTCLVVLLYVCDRIIEYPGMSFDELNEFL